MQCLPLKSPPLYRGHSTRISFSPAPSLPSSTASSSSSSFSSSSPPSSCKERNQGGPMWTGILLKGRLTPKVSQLFPIVFKEGPKRQPEQKKVCKHERTQQTMKMSMLFSCKVFPLLPDILYMLLFSYICCACI